MIDDEVRADVSKAQELARTCELAGGILDGVTWAADAVHDVELHPSWHGETQLPTAVRSALRLGRPALTAVAADCREQGRWTPLLVAVNAFGFGTSGYGAWRTRRIGQLPDVEVRLQAAVATLDADGPVDAYYLLNNEGHLHGWGPALFTRFLDVADRRSAGRALCLDPATAAAVNALVPGSDLGVADWGTAEYAFYLGLVHRIAGEAGADPVVVEATLAAKFAE